MAAKKRQSSPTCKRSVWVAGCLSIRATNASFCAHLFCTLKDYSLRCDADEYHAFRCYAYAMLVVYLAVFPMALLWTQNKKRKEKRSSTGFFRKSWWYFSVLELYQRALLTGFLLLIFPHNRYVRLHLLCANRSNAPIQHKLIIIALLSFIDAYYLVCIHHHHFLFVCGAI